MEKLSIPTEYKQWPYSIRLCFRLLLIVVIAFIIIQCKPILVPLYFSALLSILLLPLANWFEKVGIPRSLSALFSVLIALSVTAAIVYLLSAQVSTFLNDIPAIKKNLSDHYETFQHWVENSFNISASQQESLVNNAAGNMEDAKISYIKQMFFTLSELSVFVIFCLVYSFVLLYYRNVIRNFLLAVFTATSKRNVAVVLTGSKQVIKNYMTGLVIEMIIISTCNAIVLFVIGIKYAVFLGVLTGVLNILPYIGIYSGIIFTVLITLTTSAGMSQIVWIIIGLAGVHFVDTNFLMPKIVGSKVRINALMAIMGAVVGGFLIGIPGVFFALPTIAILKIIFDRMEEMKPWGILLGDEPVSPRKRAANNVKKKMPVKKEAD